MTNKNGEYFKDFDRWNINKKKIDQRESRPPYFKSGQIWWVYCGINVGTEIDGKGNLSIRPFLIIKRNGKYNAICVPATSNCTKKRNYIHKTIIKNQKTCFVLSQIKNIDSKRFFRYKTEMSKRKFKKILRALIKYIK